MIAQGSSRRLEEDLVGNDPPVEQLRPAPRRAVHQPRTLRPARAEPAGYGTTLGVGTRILTVEDDERIRTAVKMALEDEGWTVEETASGEEAIDAFGSVSRPTWC